MTYIINLITELTSIISPIFYKLLYMSLVASFIGLTILFIKKIFNKKLSPQSINIIWMFFIISLTIPINIESYIYINNKVLTNIQRIDKPSYIDNKNYIIYETKDYENNNLIINNENIKINGLNSNKEIQNIKINFEELLPLVWATGSIIILLSNILVFFSINKKVGKRKITDERVIKIFNL